MVVDGLDWAILRELQRSGRMPLAELGRRVGLGASSTGERVRQLEEMGVIRGYRADLDLSRLGYPIVAFIRVRMTHAERIPFVRVIEERPEVVECHHVTGEDCYLVRVVARSIGHLEEVANALAGHGTTTTLLVFSTLVEGRPFVKPPQSEHLAAAKSFGVGGETRTPMGSPTGS
jgi:Lrp/AsnC family transcriptional regulator, leucine-responsive regulatory protein